MPPIQRNTISNDQTTPRPAKKVRLDKPVVSSMAEVIALLRNEAHLYEILREGIPDIWNVFTKVGFVWDKKGCYTHEIYAMRKHERAEDMRQQIVDYGFPNFNQLLPQEILDVERWLRLCQFGEYHCSARNEIRVEGYHYKFTRLTNDDVEKLIRRHPSLRRSRASFRDLWAFREALCRDDKLLHKVVPRSLTKNDRTDFFMWVFSLPVPLLAAHGVATEEQKPEASSSATDKRETTTSATDKTEEATRSASDKMETSSSAPGKTEECVQAPSIDLSSVQPIENPQQPTVESSDSNGAVDADKSNEVPSLVSLGATDSTKLSHLDQKQQQPSYSHTAATKTHSVSVSKSSMPLPALLSHRSTVDEDPTFSEAHVLALTASNETYHELKIVARMQRQRRYVSVLKAHGFDCIPAVRTPEYELAEQKAQTAAADAYARVRECAKQQKVEVYRQEMDARGFTVAPPI